MKNATISTKNVKRFLSAVDALNSRGVGVEGMCAVEGSGGTGKTMAAVFAMNRFGAALVRAKFIWTTAYMLQEIAEELGARSPGHQRKKNFAFIVERLCEKSRMLIIDEADYLFKRADMVDVARDIYDTTRLPILLVGENITNEIVRNQRWKRRITQVVHFGAVDFHDARATADQLCEVKVEDDLLREAGEKAGWNMGLLVNALDSIEQTAKKEGWKAVSLKQWQETSKQLFLDAKKN